jgi:carbonic anhydrase
VKLHDPEEIIVIEHQDCGGYAQDNTIPSGLSKDDDKNLHLSYANKTKHMIEEIFPDKKVSIFYATLDGDIEPMFV